MRRWLLRIGVAALALGLLLVAFAWWLLGSAGGRDLVLGRVVAALPEGAVSWETAEGPLRGPLAFTNVRYRAEDGLQVDVGRLELVPRLRSLLGRRAELEHVGLVDVVVRLAPPDEAAEPEPFQWPGELPALDLPLAVELHGLRADRIRVFAADVDDSLVDAALLEVVGRFGNGVLDLERVHLLSDRADLDLRARVDSTRAWDTDLSGRLVLPAAEEGGARPALDIALRGDLDALALSVEGDLPEPMALRFDARALDTEQPLWTLSLQADGLDPSLFGAGDDTRVAARVEAEGEGSAVALEGRVEREELVLDIAPSRLAWSDRSLRLAPLDLRLLDGAVRLEGEVDLAEDAPVLDVEAVIAGLRYRPAADQPAVAADGRVAVQGVPEDWQLQGRVDLARAGEAGRVDLQGRGDLAHIVIDTLALQVPGGRARGEGRVDWSPALAWTLALDLEGFDPGYFQPDFDGRIDAGIRSQGRLDGDGEVQARIEVDPLGGQLRGRRLSGTATLDWAGDAGELLADVGVGGSRVRGGGAVGERLDLALELTPLRLGDLLPEAGGELVGEVAIQGPAELPDIRADLRGSGLALGGSQVASLRVVGELPGRGDGGNLRLRAGELVLGGVELERVEAQLDGALADARLDLQLRGQPGAAELSADLRRRDDALEGRLQALRYAPPRGPVWQLGDAAGFRVADGRSRLDPACLEAAAARLCVEADWPGSAQVTGRDLPLSLLEPWLAEGGLALHVEGLLALDATVSAAGEAADVEAALSSDGGSIRVDADGGREFLRYERLDVQARLAGGAAEATLMLRLAGDDRIEGRFSGGLAEGEAIDGRLDLAVNDLTFLELFSPDIVEPQGELSGSLQLGGSVDAPILSGEAGLRGFGTELPALGIRLADSELLVRGAPDGDAVLAGVLRSGDGRIDIDGRSAIVDGARRFEIDLGGADFLAADTPELRAVVSPELQVRIAENIHVRGRVRVPSARLDLERLETTTQPSRDVVVVDPIDPETGPAMPIDALVTVELGDRVELVGFGLEGRLAGSLRVRELTGRPTTATGALDVSGAYTAYGQDLRIQRGRLSWATSPVDNPALDIVAQREFDTVTVGLRVRGTALQPTSDIFSDPAMDNTEALSWLVLGRPLRTASADEGQQLGAAALALGAGGNLVAEALGARLGLDEAGVSESRALGGATFSVGKYLSPRLLVSYGVSLVGNGQVLTLKYLLGRGFDIEIESGTESRGSLNWRMER